MSDATWTEDRLYGGRIVVRQPARGYRVNADTILLAASVARGEGLVLEAGCGVGAATLIVAARFPDLRLVGVERDPGLAAFARANAAENDLSARVDIREGDALALPEDLTKLGGIFFNPPYDNPAEGRMPTPEKRGARIETAPLAQWIGRLADRLAGGGWLTLVHRADRLGEILAAMEGRLGGAEVIPIHSRAGEPARRIIVRGRKGSRAPLSLAPAIVLHDESGAKHTPHAEAILRGKVAVRDS